MPRDQIEFRDNRVFIGNQSVPFAELIKKAYMGRVSLSVHRLLRDAEDSLEPEDRAGAAVLLLLLRRILPEVLVDIARPAK